MKLSDFLSERGISGPEFGRRINVSAEAVRRYCESRVPKPNVMRKIVLETDGMVTANDFFGIEEPSSSQTVQAAE